MSKSLPRTPQTDTMPPTKPPRNQAPLTADNAALYRCILSCGIVKSACEGKGIPKDCRREDWIDYNLACAIEGLAQHLMGRDAARADTLNATLADLASRIQRRPDGSYVVRHPHNEMPAVMRRVDAAFALRQAPNPPDHQAPASGALVHPVVGLRAGDA